tara:strand:+ start:442 stop:924 length:483 start_codon:yes stop_codon:yes gene_type:complete
MKTKIFTLINLCIAIVVLGQGVPQGINYQAVARDVSGNPLVNQGVTLQLSVLSDTQNPTIQWQETHTTTTNSYGLFTVIVGQGSNTGNGLLSSFSEMDWGVASQYLVIGAKCHAAVNGKFSPDIEDVKAVATPILRHRMVKNYKAEAEGISIEQLINELL